MSSKLGSPRKQGKVGVFLRSLVIVALFSVIVCVGIQIARSGPLNPSSRVKAMQRMQRDVNLNNLSDLLAAGVKIGWCDVVEGSNGTYTFIFNETSGKSGTATCTLPGYGKLPRSDGNLTQFYIMELKWPEDKKPFYWAAPLSIRVVEADREHNTLATVRHN